MSITLYIDGWEKAEKGQTKVFADVEFPGLEAAYFENDSCYQKDSDGRWYRLEDIYSDGEPFLDATRDVRYGMNVLCDHLGFDRAGGIPSAEWIEVEDLGSSIQALKANTMETSDIHAPLISLLKMAESKSQGVYWG